MHELPYTEMVKSVTGRLKTLFFPLGQVPPVEGQLREGEGDPRDQGLHPEQARVQSSRTLRKTSRTGPSPIPQDSKKNIQNRPESNTPGL